MLLYQYNCLYRYTYHFTCQCISVIETGRNHNEMHKKASCLSYMSALFCLSLVQLQADLDKLVLWAQKWQMEFNVNKCKVMNVGNSKGSSN